jgi:hypothetical protein
MLHTQYHVCVTYPAKEFQIFKFRAVHILKNNFFWHHKKEIFFPSENDSPFFFPREMLTHIPVFSLFYFILHFRIVRFGFLHHKNAIQGDRRNRQTAWSGCGLLHVLFYDINDSRGM